MKGLSCASGFLIAVVFYRFSLFSTLLYAECTADISSRIIYGSNANSAEWPSIVALVKRGQMLIKGNFVAVDFRWTICLNRCSLF